jgi:hypothetical protein
MAGVKGVVCMNRKLIGENCQVNLMTNGLYYLFLGFGAHKGLHWAAEYYLLNTKNDEKGIGHPHMKICNSLEVSSEYCKSIALLPPRAALQVAKYFLFYGRCLICCAAALTDVIKSCFVQDVDCIRRRKKYGVDQAFWLEIWTLR